MNPKEVSIPLEAMEGIGELMKRRIINHMEMHKQLKMFVEATEETMLSKIHIPGSEPRVRSEVQVILGRAKKILIEYDDIAKEDKKVREYLEETAKRQNNNPVAYED